MSSLHMTETIEMVLGGKYDEEGSKEAFQAGLAERGWDLATVRLLTLEPLDEPEGVISINTTACVESTPEEIEGATKPE